MIEVPPQGDEPRMKLYTNLEELEKDTGEKLTHGYFDPQANLIVATLDSCAHEVGHYHDFKSGRMLRVSAGDPPLARAQARIRNEIVAILYAAQKNPSSTKLLSYEYEFLNWFFFLLQRENLVGFSRAEIAKLEFSKWKISDLQDIGEWLTSPDHSWFERLEFIFRHYLIGEHVTMTYRPKSHRR